MDQLTPLLESGATAGLATALIFQALKAFPEYLLFGKNTAHPLHDPAMRVLLFGVALVITCLSTAASLPPRAVFDWLVAWTVLKTAAGATGVALFTYHALNSDILGGLTGTQRPTMAPLTLSGTVTGGWVPPGSGTTPITPSPGSSGGSTTLTPPPAV